MEQKDKYYCKDCKQEIPRYIQRCYPCKTKWYDNHHLIFDKSLLDDDYLYE